MSSLLPPHGASGGKHHKVKPLYIWLGGGIAATGVFLYMRHRSEASALAATTAATATDSTDTSTDDADESDVDDSDNEDYGDYSAASGTSPSLYGYDDDGTFISDTGSSTVLQPTTNAQWVQEAVAQLEQYGDDPETVSLALGKYILGGSLTAAQLSIVQSAIGALGYPPTAVPAPHTAPSTGQSTATSLKAPTMAPPKGVNSVLAQLSWSAVSGATRYYYYRNGLYIGQTAATSVRVPRVPAATYYVKAGNGKVNSALSNGVKVSPEPKAATAKKK